MGDIDPGEVSKFGELLQQGDFQESFRSDPLGALRGAGVSTDGLPPELVETVSGLSPEEFRVFAKVQTKLGRAAGGAHGLTFF
jgi:hypothetical protein